MMLDFCSFYLFCKLCAENIFRELSQNIINQCSVLDTINNIQGPENHLQYFFTDWGGGSGGHGEKGRNLGVNQLSDFGEI